jgi:uncharacterized SAM-binding protein YcdF (DUF218 family)
MLVLTKVLTYVFLPPGLFVLLIAASAVLAGTGKKRAATALASLSAGLLLLLSLGPVSDALLLPLENAFPPIDASRDAVASASHVVVLGAGSVGHSPEEGMRGSLSDESEKRFLYGVRIAADFGKPLIYSGGRVFEDADVEADPANAIRLLHELGIRKEVLVEDESATTWENALKSREKFGLKEVIVVTSAYHIPRAILSFEKNGVKAIAAPTDYKVGRTRYHIDDFLPNVGALGNSYKALHEYVGILQYSFKRPPGR